MPIDFALLIGIGALFQSLVESPMFCMITGKNNATIIAPDYDWV